MPSKSVLILGGGVIGLAVAHYAARVGHRVTILERGKPDHDCCSLGNAGMVVPSHFVPLAAPGMVGMGLRMMLDPESPFHIRPRLNPDLLDWAWKFSRSCTARHVERSAPLLRDLGLASRRCFEELSQLPGADFGLVQKGLLMLCRDAATLHEEGKTVELARALGIQAELLSSKEAAELEPGVQMAIAGAAYFPQDCHLSPEKFFATLRQANTDLGVETHYETEATGWTMRDGKIVAVRTNYSDYTADEYVLAGGSWSPMLVRSLEISMPIQAGKGYSMTLAAPRKLPNLCAILTEARVAVTPMGSSLRFAGTMEIAGIDHAINTDRVRGIVKSIPRYYPEFREDDFKELPIWHGLRPCSPDGLPYLGRFQRYPNLSAATGHAMMGLSLAPITGKLMAQVLSDEKPSIDLSLLRPDRYA